MKAGSSLQSCQSQSKSDQNTRTTLLVLMIIMLFNNANLPYTGGWGSNIPTDAVEAYDVSAHHWKPTCLLLAFTL